MKRNEFIKTLALGAGALILWPGSAASGRNITKPENVISVSKEDLLIWSHIINDAENEVAVTETSIVVTRAYRLLEIQQNVQSRRVAAIEATKHSGFDGWLGYNVVHRCFVKKFQNASERDYFISLLTSNETWDRVYHIQHGDHSGTFASVRQLCDPKRAHHDIVTVYLSELRESSIICSTALVSNECTEGFKPFKTDVTDWNV